MKEIYSDGLFDIYVARGLAYLDFYHLIPDAAGHHEQVPFLRLTLPLTLKGFFGLVQTGDNVLRHLIEAGVVTVTPSEPEPAEKAAEPVAGKKPGKKDAKPAPAKKAEAKPAAKPAPAPAKKAEAKPAAKPAPAPAKKAEAKPAAKPAPAPAKKAEAKPAAKGKKTAK